MPNQPIRFIMRYFKRYWNECLAQDGTTAHGWTWCFFETDEKNKVLRQVDMYESGHTLRYSIAYPRSKFGGLSDEPLDTGDANLFESGENEFNRAWGNGEPFFPNSPMQS